MTGVCLWLYYYLLIIVVPWDVGDSELRREEALDQSFQCASATVCFRLCVFSSRGQQHETHHQRVPRARSRGNGDQQGAYC
jgi:hypothetical protein